MSFRFTTGIDDAGSWSGALSGMLPVRSSGGDWLFRGGLGARDYQEQPLARGVVERPGADEGRRLNTDLNDVDAFASARAMLWATRYVRIGRMAPPLHRRLDRALDDPRRESAGVERLDILADVGRRRAPQHLEHEGVTFDADPLDGDVVQARPATGDFRGEAPLQLARHADEYVLLASTQVLALYLADAETGLLQADRRTVRPRPGVRHEATARQDGHADLTLRAAPTALSTA